MENTDQMYPPDSLRSLCDSPTAWESLASSWGMTSVRFSRSAESTQDVARSLPEPGAPGWVLVATDHQTAGRGRHGRTWRSAPGTGLTFSLTLRPQSPEAMSLLPIRTGLAVAAALDTLPTQTGGPVGALLKWPNDIILHNGKLGGILCEGVVQGQFLYAVVGIGINVFPFGYVPEEMRGLQPAFLSDAVQTGPETRLLLLERIAGAMRRMVDLSSGTLSDTEQAMYAARDWLRGRSVQQPQEGRAAGINERGHLLIEHQGVVRAVVAGDVVSET